MTAPADEPVKALDTPGRGTKLAIAQAQAEASRAQLRGRLSELRARTRPAALIGEVKDVARAHAFDLAAAAARQPRARTLIAAGAISAGLAYLFRKPLLKALAKRLIPESKS
jgi:hypothetical protein